MFIKLFTILLVLIVFIGLGMIKIDDKYKFKLNKKQLLTIIPCVIIVLLMCIAVVPANTVGVKYSSFSGTSEKTLGEGIHFKTPFDTIYEIDTTVQERTGEKIKVQTSDAQSIDMEVNIKYQVSNKDAFKVYKGYKTLHALDKNIIANYAQSVLSEVCTQYNIIDILGNKRNEVVIKASDLLKNKYAIEGVTFKDMTIKKMSAGDALEEAIEAEAIAKKSVETAEQNKLKAQKDAETKLITAQGEANANAVKTSQLTDQILIEQWIERWDGKLPTVSGSDGNMIDISKLLGK